MTIFDATFNPVPVIVGLVVGAIVIAGILVLLNFTVFAHLRLKKQVRELNRKFEYLHALLFGQDSQLVKRLEIIARTNLVYVEIHMNYNKRFKDIRDKGDSLAQNTINKLRDMLTDKKWKELKEELPDAKNVIAKYEGEVNALTDSLTQVVKPEEECRQQALTLKEKLRSIKQEYYTKQADLILLTSSFEELFANLEKAFEHFEACVESANYDDAKAMLPSIGRVVDRLGKIFPDLPTMCITIQSVIPNKLSSVKNQYEEMLSQGFPLQHLNFRIASEEIEAQVKDLTKRIQDFKVVGVQEELDAILARLDTFVESFESEKEAREIFLNECAGIYEEDTTIEKKYIKLCNSMPSVKRLFVVTDEEQAKIDMIKNQINKAGATKRSLDTFIHSGTKQPYTMLVEKMHHLHDEADQALNAISDFERYLLSLKEDSETAAKAISEYYARLKESEKLLREISVQAINDRYSAGIVELYNIIDNIYALLNNLPINVGEVNGLVATLKRDGDEITGGILHDYKKMLLCDASVIYGNRDRGHLGEVNAIMSHSESLYYSGDFQSAYDETLNVLRRLNEER